MATTDAAFEEILAGRAAETARLARAARALIRELDPDVVEVPWPKQGIIGYGIGPKKYSQHYAYLALYGNQVNVGFNQAAELDDPTGLLGGSGKTFGTGASTAWRCSRSPSSLACSSRLAITGRRHPLNDRPLGRDCER